MSHRGFFSLWDWGLNSGLCACKAGALLLEPQPQTILVWLFWRWGLVIYLPGLASSCNPPSLSLLSSEEYRHEPLVPSKLHFIHQVTNALQIRRTGFISINIRWNYSI
jgi:hypothetical protein